MDLMIQVAAVCVAGALLALILKQGSPALALTLTVGIVVAVGLFLAGAVRELAVFFQELGERSGLSQELLQPLYKTVGIALVVRVGSALCRDAGESALASAIETAGTVCVLLCALPLMRSVLTMLLDLIEVA